MHHSNNIKIAHKLTPAYRSEILSVGSYLPDQRVKSDDIMEELHSFQQYGMPTNWMSKEMGIEERRMAPDEFNPSDLAIRAGREALENCTNLNPQLIDAVIFCGIERDHPEPATAHTIQNKLGLKANHVFDVANACYGFVDGLKLATAMIESNMINYALVVTGEVSTRVLKAVVGMLKKGVTKEKANTLWGALSLGDAGGAVILGQADNDSTGFRAFNQKCDSRQVDRCHYKFRPDGSVDGQMQMAQIVARGFQLNKGMLGDTLKMLGWDGFDWALTHQTGKRTFQQTLTLQSINDDKLVKTYPYLGNITTATLPVCLKKLLDTGLVKKGDRIGGLFAGSGITTGQFGYIV